MILREGTYLQNRYEILERVGSGGMSEVYKARDRKLNRLVAIKVLKDEYCDNAEFVSKFKYEAQSAAGLSHPNVVSVYDVIDEGELHYIVMELVEGVTLKNFILAKGKLDIKEAIVISIQVAQGLGAAHDQNIVHRDIKPQNMIMSSDGKVKVADFGIAGAVSSDTINSIAMGSVHYLSPEQAKGEPADERSDIYSLGITMYEMVTGQLPFNGDTTVSIAIQQIENELPLPSLLNPAVTPAFETIILKCTQKRPERRYQNISDLVVDLRKALMDPATSGIIPQKQEEEEYHTKVISPEELGEINSQAKIQNEKNKTVSRPKSKSASLREQIYEDEEEEETKSDKFVTVLGILLAIVIVGAAIFFITKFTGLLNTDNSISSILQSDDTKLPDTQVYMPNVIDMPYALAEKMLNEDYSLNVKFQYDENAEYESGKVFKQEPEEGKVVDKYSAVTLYVSQGTDTINLENEGIFGEQLEIVKKKLDKLELSCNVEEAFSDNIDAGCVIDYNPKVVEKGGEVVLTVSKGPENINAKVPSIIGLSEDDAIALLVENELQPGEVTEVSTEVSGTLPGLVCSQAVEAGTEIAKQTKINYSISVDTLPTESTVDPLLIDPTGETIPTLPTGTGTYVASINETFDLKNKVGPGASDMSIFVTIKLVQTGPDGTVYEQTLMQPREIVGNTLIPVRFKEIEGVYGLDRGEVQVQNANTGEVYKSYTVEFFNVD